jgi:RNA polymerase sigma factor (sigma-70 family)
LTVTQPPSGAAILPREFERIFREHYEFVYRTARHITGNSQDAEDVVQTLFLRLLGRQLAGDVNANPRGYLYRAAVNIALDVLRARKRRAYTDDDPELLVAGGEAQAFATLRDVLAELHPKSAEILILYHLHGYSHSEIATLLGTSQGTIAVSLFRSRSRLRKSLRGQREKKK